MPKLSPLIFLAWRESRFARRRLLLFLSAISLGVAALVATQSFSAAMAAGVRDEARALLGADLALRARQPFSPRVEALIDSASAAGTPTARVTSFASMVYVPRTAGTRLAQVRAVEGPFPFYGTIATKPAGAWRELQRGEPVALVDAALLVALDARLGDTLSLGEAHFRIAGTLESVPGDIDISAAFAPRVYIAGRYLEATGLLGFGSRVEHEAFFRFDSPVAASAWAAAHRAVLRAERVTSRTADQRQELLGDTLGRLGAYLGLIGVFALLLGGIGVASAMGAYMRRKADTVAVLRCLGATAPQVFVIYLLQAAVLGFVGAAIGAGIGVAAQWALPRLFAGLLPVEAKLALHPAVIGAGIGVGVWVALVFALLPLLGTRHVSPLGALRRRTEPPQRSGRHDASSLAAWAALGTSALLLATWQAGSVRIGAAFVLGIAAVLALLWLAAWAAMRGLRGASPRALPYVVRQGLANLYRPGNQTRAVVLALGFGVFLLATLLVVQHNLLRPLQVEGGTDRANLLLWDVQPDQEPALEALLAESGAPVVQSAPIVPMRVAALNGVDVRTLAPQPESGETGEGEPERDAEGGRRRGRGGAGAPAAWALRREYRSTYRDSLVGSERVVTGEWKDSGFGIRDSGGGAREASTGETVYPLSLEVGVAEDLGVGLGDRIDWDVQGVRVATEVTSLREVDWARFEPNFFAVFPPAALEAAPHSFVVLSRAGSEAERVGLQRTVVERFPNVAVLDLTQVQQTLDTVIGRVSAVIRFLAGFSVATGFVVLLGAVATGRLERIHESVLLRALGATRRQVAAILAVEYTLLGALAALVGVGLAVGAGWALARWLFDLPYGVAPPPLLLLGGGVAALALAIGMWASREVYAHTPLEVLREE